MSYDRVEKIPHRIMFFISVAYVGLVFFPAFLNKGPLLQTDQPLWVATTHVWLEEVMPEQHWIWGSISDRASAGIVMSGIYSAPLIIPWLLSHVVSVSTAVKVSMVLCALAFIVSFYLLSCMYMPRGYALLCSLAILSPVFDNLVSGMWYNYFGLACAFIFWVVSNKYRAEGGIVAFIICVLAFTLAIYSHPVGMILCFLIWFSQVFVMLRLTSLTHATNVIIFLLLPIVSILLSFPQIQAIIDLSDANALPDSKTVQLHITPFFETIRRTTFIRVWGATTITPLKAVIMGFNILCTFITAVLGLWYLFTKKRWNELIPIGIIGLGTFMLISKLYNAAYIFFGITLGSKFLINLSDFYSRFQ